MKNRKFLVITMGFVLALIGLGPVPTNALSSFTPSSVKTWTGGGSDGDWSTSANWSGGVAPANGDSVIIDNSANFSNGSTVDTALSLYSLSFINNASSPGVVYTDMMQDLTITHDITQQASATSTFNIIRAVPSSVRTLHLGGNVTVTSKYMMRLGDSDGNDFIELNNYDLTFNDQGTDSSVEIYSVIHGTGIVTFDAQNTDFTLYASNTYSGPTNVTSSKSPVTIENATLGSSRIYIGPNGSLALKSNTSQTFPNNIEVSGMPDVASSSLKFIATASGVTFTVPNITLDDTSVFETNLQNQAGVQVNLAGITTNNFCLVYLGNSNTSLLDPGSNGFTNAPANCVPTEQVPSDSSSTTPKSPNTGFKLLTTSPLLTLSATILLSGCLVVLGRKLAKNINQ